MYDSSEYADERLRGTVVRLNNGEPFLVSKVTPGFMVHGATLEKNEMVTKLSNVDVSSPPLGFFQEGKSAIYVVRIPKRRDWKQGVRPDNTQVMFPVMTVVPSAIKLMRAIKSVPTTSVADAIAAIEAGKLDSLAIHRHWALGCDGSLVYKWSVVGRVSKDGVWTFKDAYSYLESRFYEDVVNANTQDAGLKKKAG